MKLSVYDIEGKITSEQVELNQDVFGVIPSKHILYLAVKTYLANQRQGNAKTKTRREVNGSTKKLFRQKGTGGARRGNAKSPLMFGGGKTFGPVLRSYYTKMNKKMKVLARKSAYSDKAIDENIYIIDNFKFAEPKTSRFIKVLNGIGVFGKKVLVLFDSYSYLDDDLNRANAVNLIKSVRNIKNVYFQTADNVTAYEILNADYLIIQKDALKTIDRINA